MTGLVANVILNIFMVGLLAATIAYCVILNRRIQILQDSRSELASLLKQFDESTMRASETIIAMQTASKKIGDNIQMKLDKANYLLDDLSYAIEKGVRLTSQIDASFAVGRAKNKVMSDEAPLQSAVELQPEEIPHAEKPPAKPSSAKRNPASIEAILEKVVNRKQQDLLNAGAKEMPPAPAASRSRAEQELIDLIRSSSKG